MAIGLEKHVEEIDIKHPRVLRNASPARLYEQALAHEGAAILAGGALATFSGEKTGRSPQDKRIVHSAASADDVWWGSVNIPATEAEYLARRREATAFLSARAGAYVVDGYAGWDPEYRIKVRVICARAYHALFMRNLLIRPTRDELENFGEPDLLILNAGDRPAAPLDPGSSSRTAVLLHLERRELVILGTNYAGEMKKGVFTAMNYWMPRRGVLSMHCSANRGEVGDVSLFFGLSGTGKTTLSSDPRRRLIGDDEHAWSDRGVFNIEGGCYAKCIGLRESLEPQIHRAIRFGSVLENVVFDPETRVPDYDDGSITENTRACYPIEHIDEALIPCASGHPSNIIFLACDAFGVLPPVSRLTPAQALYHFLSGYTAKVAGTEVGVSEPQATFSACFGAAFLVLHPVRYAEMLAERIAAHRAATWLVNTGWTGGPYGVGKRMNLHETRAIIDAIHAGALGEVATVEDPIFGLNVPAACPGVPAPKLMPRNTWPDPDEYDRAALRLSKRFRDNFLPYQDQAPENVRQAGPRI
ncbi:MAG: phosphoenolpyruvate carboxykinase (ATP) [Isosphaeraceae bacterium]